jgi:hypothetical protein
MDYVPFEEKEALDLAGQPSAQLVLDGALPEWG